MIAVVVNRLNVASRIVTTTGAATGMAMSGTTNAGPVPIKTFTGEDAFPTNIATGSTWLTTGVPTN